MLMIPDAGLKLLPGEVAPVPNATDQIKRGLATGALVEVDVQSSDRPTTARPQTSATPSAPLSKLNATEAIAQIQAEADPATLQSYLATEKRKTVLDVLKTRLAEVSGDAT